MTNVSRKLVLVTDINHLKLYEANGLKITNILLDSQISELITDGHDRHQHYQGHFSRSGGSPSHCQDLQEESKNNEREDTARFIIAYLEKLTQKWRDYKELIIVADPKNLGHLRHSFSKHLKALISKEVAKDLTHQDIQQIEKTVFA